MILTEEQKQAIHKEFDEWVAVQYAGKTKEERQKLGQFFTPPALTIKMIEKFDTIIDKDILDPTVGAGGLLIGCVLAGADPNRVYGIELDPEILKICRSRLAKYGVPKNHIRQGDALLAESYDFDNVEVPEEELEEEILQPVEVPEPVVEEPKAALEPIDDPVPVFKPVVEVKAVTAPVKKKTKKPVVKVEIAEIIPDMEYTEAVNAANTASKDGPFALDLDALFSI